MVKTVAAGKVQHTINCKEETWDALTRFKDANSLGDYGAALDGLLDFFLRFQEALPAAEDREATARKAIADAAGVIQREGSLRVWETQQAQAAQVPYLPISILKELIEDGIGAEDIKDIRAVIDAAGVPAIDLARSLESVGGLIALGEQLQKAVDDLAAKKDSLSAQFVVKQAEIKDEITAAAMRLAELQGQTEEVEQYRQGVLTDANQEIGGIRQRMAYWDQTYRLLGVTFEAMKGQLGKAGRIELLPLRAQLFLAGSILTTAEQIWGDYTWDIPETAENAFPIRLRLSELPLIFAPAEAYKPQVDLVRKQLERRDQYRDQGDEDLLGGEDQLGEGEE